MALNHCNISIGDRIVIHGGPAGALSPTNWLRFKQGSFRIQVTKVAPSGNGTLITGIELTPGKSRVRRALLTGPAGGQWNTDHRTVT